MMEIREVQNKSFECPSIGCTATVSENDIVLPVISDGHVIEDIYYFCAHCLTELTMMVDINEGYAYLVERKNSKDEKSY